jgi:hypothetical protein
VPLRVAAILLGRTLLSGSSNLPGSSLERAAPPPLFGLAPRGVCHAGEITPTAVRSYRTISPLPDFHQAVYFLLHFPSIYKSIQTARPLAGTLPYGDRTFLPFPGGCPVEGTSCILLSHSGGSYVKIYPGSFKILRIDLLFRVF